MRFQTKQAARVLTLSALAMAMTAAWAEDKGHPAAGKAEAAYEAQYERSYHEVPYELSLM